MNQFMSRNPKPIIEDPEDFDGTYVSQIGYEDACINDYDIRAFAKYKRETGKIWDELTAEEKDRFRIHPAQECKM